MNSRIQKIILTGLFIMYVSGAPSYVFAVDDNAALNARIELLEKQLSEIKGLLKQQVQNSATKEEVNAVKKEVEVAKSEQAEWKSYDSGVHLAGYGAVNYSAEVDQFNKALFAPIFHYQYKDLFLLESELEIEVKDDGDTEVALEYLTVDWFMNDYMTLLAGKFLSPVGQFRQNIHPTWINKMVTAPVGFGHDQAAPVAELGAQFRGGFPLSETMNANYALYVSNGPILELNEDGDEIEAVEYNASTDDVDDNKTFGGRIGLTPLPNTEIGFSGAFGDIAIPGEDERDYDVIGVDFFGRWKNFDLRGEYVRQQVDALVTSAAPESQEWEAFYTQLSYKFLPTKFEAVTRYGDYNSNHADQEQEQWAFGLNYLFAPNAMVKLSYELNDGLAGTTTDQDQLLIQLTYGF
jgi:Gram-negative porin